mmetsp:Transcript_83776/g.269905  ORF Transcript_83776/g.269905 Transcript_83776/m.269905 type:complete len:762 (+) Transcript_83776:73-2358(+)
MEAVSAELWKYSMTWPAGRLSVTKMSDFEVALDPECMRLPRAPVDWPKVRAEIATCVSGLDDGESSRGCAGSVERLRSLAGKALDVDTRFSSPRNDCFLGSLAVSLCDVACSLAAFLLGDVGKMTSSWELKWRKVQLDLEGMSFYVELPWLMLMQAGWHLPSLLSRLGTLLQRAASDGANSCDNHDYWADTSLLQYVGADGAVSLDVAENYIITQGTDAFSTPGRCPFGIVTALLSVALAVVRSGTPRATGPLAGLSPVDIINTRSQIIMRIWEEVSDQFFFDTLASHWRMFSLLEALSFALAGAGSAVVGAGAIAGSAERLRWAPSLQQPRRCREYRRHWRSRWARGPRRVLFLGGGETTYQWGSFTVRARQVARGLRMLGLDARTWNSPCTHWCSHAARTKEWLPTTIVHVKYICECALAKWRSMVHIYDPVDVFINEGKSGLDLLLEVDAVLVQTSVALGDLSEHPPWRVAGNVSIFWHPIHHSNMHELHIHAEDTVHRVGVHTVHRDAMLYDTIGRHASRIGVQFVHLDPGLLFKYANGRVTTPQQTDALYQQLATLDAGFVKQSGCVTEWWFCSRWKTGQRLVNMLSVGIPSVVWGDAQGHVDVVEGLWLPEAEDEDGSAAARRQRTWHRHEEGLRYPRELVVGGDADVPRALDKLIANASLRAEASRIGLRLASRFSLPRLAARLARILGRLEARRLPRAAAATSTAAAAPAGRSAEPCGWRLHAATAAGCEPPWMKEAIARAKKRRSRRRAGQA